MRGWIQGFGLGVLVLASAGPGFAQAPTWAPATHPAARASVADLVPKSPTPPPAPIVSLMPVEAKAEAKTEARAEPKPTASYATLGLPMAADREPVVRAKAADEDEAKPRKSAKADTLRPEDDPFLGSPGISLGSVVPAKSEGSSKESPAKEGSAKLVSHSEEERFNSGVLARRSEDTESLKAGDGGTGTSWLTSFNKFWHFGEANPDRQWFQSDCPEAFDSFISPVSNPFLFEDPRALTEIRPLFTFQTIPDDAAFFNGGNAIFFGTRGSVAFTDRWSITLNKLGFTAFNGGDGSAFGDNIGFSEIWFGPKFTFWRAPETGTVAAGGAIFQIPTGQDDVFQDTGSGSVVPYLSFAQNFRFPRFGSLNFMSTAGYSFRFDDDRSDFFYGSFHLDYDIQNAHKYYPLVELNWFHYTRDGGARPFLNVEGRDLANFGAPVSGHDMVSVALGGRYRVCENGFLGAAAEFPLISPKDVLDFRVTIDFIYKY